MKMKMPTMLFWLWLAYSGLLTWCSPGSYPMATAQENDEPFESTTTFSPPLETTDNPSYDYNIENIDTDTTTSKVGRNYGGRIRGINSLPYGNSVNSNGTGFLRPRPTPSVISFNPSNYNRVLKRRKNSTAIEGSPFRTRTTPPSLKTNAFLNNYFTVNRTRVIPQDQRQDDVAGKIGGGEIETVVPSSQVNRSSSQKFTVRKRPRPITISDSVETTTSMPITTTSEPEEITVEPATNSVENRDVVTTGIPPLVNNSSVVPPVGRNETENNVLRVAKQEPTVLPLAPINASTISSKPSLTAEPVSHVPVFEYNPSVTVKDGIYRFHYSEPAFTSKRVHKEDFGVSHVTYGSDGEDDVDDGDETLPETTTFAPDERHTTIPYHINIDGSEEEFTSSLPPAYRDYIANDDNHERVAPVAADPQAKSKAVVTVTVTHTIVADTSTTQAKANEISATAASEESNTIKKDGGVHENPPVNNNMIHATPALPDSAIQPVTRNQSEVSHIQSSSVADTTVEVTHREDENPPSGSNAIEKKPAEGSSPSPHVTSKVVTSVFYTKAEHPYYTTSSYSFTESTTYSYGHPEDDHHYDDEHHDHHHEPTDEHKGNSVVKQPQELRPTTSSFWDTLGKQSIDLMRSNGSSSSSNSGSSSTEDQDSGYSTPEAETEVPPGKIHTTPIPTYEEDHSEDNEIDDGAKAGISEKTAESGIVSHVPIGPGIIYDDQNAELPSVPVYIQVLVEMPARSFCSKISIFKQMVAAVYSSQLGVTPEQVIVANEVHCSNITLQHNHHNGQGPVGNETNLLNESSIKYATTTATVLRTISSSKAPSVIPPKRSNPIRVKRHGHSSAHHAQLETNSSTSSKETNVTEITGRTTRVPSVPTTALYPVFFYLNDKNGTYDRPLTESFIHYWNSSKPENIMFYDKIKKVEMITPTQGIIGEASNNENTGIIAAITIASIAAVCLFLLAVLLLVMRHRQAQSKFAKRCTPVSLDDYSLDNISVYNSFRRKQRNRASKRSYTNAGFDDPNAPSRPCNAQALTAIISEAAKIEDEFLNLPTMSPTLDDIPQGAETKNRYANVIPIPDTRVLLTFQEDVPNSDYINANFVRGPMGTSKGYIITQGPLDETVVDFWRMVWEQQIRVIMMLTDFSEAGIAKCAEYYPRSETVDSSQLHGDFQITLEKRDITDNCITSYLVIKDMERNLRRDVIHLWYHLWPEKGVPNNPKSTIDFLLKSRKFTKEPTPVLVHCSPGTGRSGCLVACDICMREWDTQRNVNIPRTVMKVRQDRAGAVQTKEQYMHIYQALQSYASRLTVGQTDPV